jgi:hypothetical protein
MTSPASLEVSSLRLLLVSPLHTFFQLVGRYLGVLFSTVRLCQLFLLSPLLSPWFWLVWLGIEKSHSRYQLSPSSRGL